MKSSPMLKVVFAIGIAVIVAMVFVPNAAFAANPPKVNVCHIPPGNPANFHTISISPSALPAHLAHGDFAGACNAHCAQLCNDGNACTIDDRGNCESAGCPNPHPPVDCSDGNLCTADSCDPTTGCQNRPVVCTAPDACTASACSAATGSCVDTPIVCPAGQACNAQNGLCEDVTNPDPECEGQNCSNFTTCNSGGSCGVNGVCGSTAEGGGLCVDGTTACAGLTPCPGGSSDCGAAAVCVVDSCCGGPVCVPAAQFCSNAFRKGTTSEKELLLTPQKNGPVVGSKD